jgi:hypothetical protein
MQTGDNNVPHTFECAWIKGLYDAGLDTWAWSSLYSSGAAGGTYKTAGIIFYEPNVLVVDDNTIDNTRIGMWSCAIADLGSSVNFVEKLKSAQAMTGMVAYNDKFITHGYLSQSTRKAVISSQNQIAGITGNRIFTPDYGVQYEVLTRILPPDTNGWHLCHVKKSTETFSEIYKKGGVMWFKFK